MKTFNFKPTWSAIVFLVICIALSCSDDDETVKDTSILRFRIVEPVMADGVINELARTVKVSVPFGTDLSAINVDVVTSTSSTVSPASGAVVNFSNGPVTFSVTGSGQTSTYTVTVEEGAAPPAGKVVFIGTADNVAGITEPDTKAAAEWAQTTFGNDFIYLKIDNITTEALSNAKVIYWYFDETGVARNNIIPAAAISAEVKNALTDWFAAGGNFLLAGYATQYIEHLGRIPSTYAPGIYGDGNGGFNNDNWGINAGTGLVSDRTTHPIYAGLTATKVINPTTNPPAELGHEFFPLISTGHKEDHNSMWDLNAIADLNGAPSKGAKFEELTNSLILGTWQHVTDLCCAAVIEFLPTEAYEGSIIAIGPASYEWEINDGAENPWKANVEKLTENSINYLREK